MHAKIPVSEDNAAIYQGIVECCFSDVGNYLKTFSV